MLFYLYWAQGSYYAGLSILGSSFNNFYIPSRIYLIDILAFQSSSSFKILKQTVPEYIIFILLISKYPMDKY